METTAQKNRYRQRVLHRVRDHSSPTKEPLNVFESESLTPKQKEVFSKYLPKEAFPILLYWRNENTWTILDANFVYSFFDENLTVIELDKITSIGLDGFKDDMTVKESRTLKMNCEFLYIGNLELKIWGFSGNERGFLFTLWNVISRYQIDKKYILSL